MGRRADMGPGMMRGGPGPYGQPPCAGWGGPGDTQSQVTEEKAKTAVQQYTDKYFKGYKIERILPFVAMSGMTRYQAELTGPNGESRVLHINPWGDIMPFGGPQARAKQNNLANARQWIGSPLSLSDVIKRYACAEPAGIGN